MIHTKSPLKKACNITDIVWRIDYLPTTMHKKTNIALNVANYHTVVCSYKLRESYSVLFDTNNILAN